MYTRRYFVASLALPLVILVLGILLFRIITAMSMNHVGAIVVPYACFFLVLALWSMRSSPKVMRHTAYRAPVIFLAFEAAYLVVEFIAGDSLAKDLLGLGGLLVIVSIYVVLLGYLYTLLMEQGYFSYLYQKRHQAHLKNKLQS